MDGISTPIQHVIDLFATDLAEVRFADVNGETLARLAADVKTGSESLHAAQASLDTARRTLESRQEALLQHVQRALAYARVYAEGDEALSQRIDAIALPRATRRVRGTVEDALVLSPAPQKVSRSRGRPSKRAAETTSGESSADG